MEVHIGLESVCQNNNQCIVLAVIFLQTPRIATRLTAFYFEEEHNHHLCHHLLSSEIADQLSPPS